MEKFTFHYVSIKSKMEEKKSFNWKKFTFHYVSIKSCGNIKTVLFKTDLHSTMYLLNLINSSDIF